jgi:hypothetical protein
MGQRVFAGERVIVTGVEATCRGDNPRIPGDYWIEFDAGGGWWSFHPNDVVPAAQLAAVTSPRFVVYQCTNPDTNRSRWGVLDRDTNVMHWPRSRGHAYAVRLLARLKEQAAPSPSTQTAHLCQTPPR